MPTKEVNKADLLLGKGKVYLDRFDSSGNKTGERFLGEVEAFELTPNDERIKKYSHATAAAPLIADALVRRTYTLKMTVGEFSKENFALALMGDVSALAQGSGSVSAEAVAGVLQGYYYKLAYRQVSAVVVNGTGGTPTYVAGTDYEVDAVTGRIYIIPGGSITDAIDLEVDYDYAADTSETVRGGTSSTIEGLVRFIGDPSQGPKWEVEVWKASISPTGTIALIGDDFANAEISAEVEDDSENHASEPFFRAIKRS